MATRRETQLHLFGADDGAPGAAVGQHLAALGERLRAWPLHLATSSWQFPGWAGIVYPPQFPRERLARDGLAQYARHPLLRAAGVDRGYYRAVAAGEYAEYARQVPGDFRFIVKAVRDLTTPALQLPAGERAPVGRYLDRDYLLREVIAPVVEGLGARAGGVLLQFPPLPGAVVRRPQAFFEGLRRLLTGLPAHPPCFVELRNPELYRSAYFDVLAATGARHCYSVHPGAPPLAQQRDLAGDAPEGPLCVRWNLRRDRRYEEAREAFAPFDRLVIEDPATRGAVADLVVEALVAGRSACVIANNKAEGSAPLTLEKLALDIDARLPAR
jgi:uncharacterized protein YecE (DUF72 family)